MPNAPSKLPSITRFLTGLITNRNPVDTPFSMVQTHSIMHWDTLIDGVNTELSAYNTMTRRPGWVNFLAGSANDIFQYKDLNGAITLFSDTGASLVDATSNALVKTNSAGAGAWTLQGIGNFLYGANGVDAIRVENTALTTALPWGQATPQIPLQLTLNSLGYYNAVTGFIPAADIIGGSIVVSDPSNNRTLTITVNNATIHFNVTYTGNVISQNNSYTQTNVQTQTGTAPNQTDVNVITVVSAYQDLLTSAGTSNGVMNYYPNTGISTLDFDVGFSAGTMTLGGLEAIINTQAAVNWPGKRVNVPVSAAALLSVFTSATLVSGLYHQPGQSPVKTQVGKALNLTYAAYYDYFSASGQTVQFTSGLYDVTNPQLSLGAQIGSAPRLYQYTSPSANITDTFTGTITLSLVAGSTGTASFNIVNKTLAQIAVAIESASWNSLYVQTGTTGYIVLRNFHAVSPSNSQDSVLTMDVNTLVDNQDLNANFQNWIFTESNDWAQLPLQGINIAYATRDTISGGLSNISVPVTIGTQTYPIRYIVSLVLPSTLYDHTVTNIEVYRTVDGGSSYLFEQVAGYLNGTNYSTSFGINDDQLNPQLIGPIDEEADAPPIGLRNIVSHSGRLFGVVGNRVYYSGGPDTTNGNGDEAWPPGNNFQFPGNITDIKSLGSGTLAVALTDDLHTIEGVDSSSYYQKPWLTGFGISNATAWVKDAGGLYLYTTTQQLHSIAPGESLELGFDIGDILLADFPATTTSLTFHRGSSLDTALYISNGTDTIFRYNTAQRAWSPKCSPLVPAGRIKSLEVSTANQTLLNVNTGSGSGIWARSLTTFTDNGAPYPAFFTIGVMQVAPLGTQASINSVSMQQTAVGTLAQPWILLNEINDSQVPFTRLFNPVNDPPDAPSSLSLWAKRWYIHSTLTPLPSGFALTNLVSLKVVLSSTDTVKNEIIGVFLRDRL